MRKIFGAAMVLVMLLSCKQKKSDGKFEVTGKLTNAGGKTVYLIENSMFTRGRTIADSAKIGNDGKYSLKANPDEATAYTLQIEGSGADFATVFNDAKKISLDASFNAGSNFQTAENYEIKGSEASTQAKEFLSGVTMRLQQLYFSDMKADSLRKIKASDSLLMANDAQRIKFTEELKDFVSASIKKSTNPALTFYELGNYQPMAAQFGLKGIPNEEVDAIINDMVTKYPNHEGWAYIKRSISEKANKGWVGKEAPEIAMPDANGNIVKLSSYRGKYVLVDFWASWCGPCRMENPNVVAAYNKYKDKNFDILGVSLDNPGGKDKWLAAIKKDNLTWTQVTELKGWETSSVGVYGFGEEGIPYNILVDPQGKIIAEKLRGSQLDAKLAEVLK
ncbi:MAG: AhpC/TSA family protein [Chitinophagaceae bacterium]|nr:AhpC/TSA family protein [Chitinophagaceae bacterium]HMX76771.1 TlpA disulfide reductase family protein [Chitinophagaceae bacterium]HNJ24995.1 TlpA disulfide reductase family protein [Chitinophagaceae bacterium]HNJ55299.1 TlpA disulfide reductase family protein [Chitinophagaceae bacterium]HNO54030.1 TlpA disulfide reductase family protein [Chitinophagaceae bacterium]